MCNSTGSPIFSGSNQIFFQGRSTKGTKTLGTRLCTYTRPYTIFYFGACTEANILGGLTRSAFFSVLFFRFTWPFLFSSPSTLSIFSTGRKCSTSAPKDLKFYFRLWESNKPRQLGSGGGVPEGIERSCDSCINTQISSNINMANQPLQGQPSISRNK